jgi:hypothetical protein
MSGAHVFRAAFANERPSMEGRSSISSTDPGGQKILEEHSFRSTRQNRLKVPKLAILAQLQTITFNSVIFASSTFISRQNINAMERKIEISPSYFYDRLECAPLNRTPSKDRPLTRAISISRQAKRFEYRPRK